MLEREGTPLVFLPIYGERPDLEQVRRRMEQHGLAGDPIEARMMQTAQTSKRSYWLRVWAVLIEGKTYRIYQRRGAGIYSPWWLLGEM